MSEMKLKVSEKGGVSLYGLGRFPVTLYKGQWEKLLGEVDNIRKFLEENADKLAVKESGSRVRGAPQAITSSAGRPNADDARQDQTLPRSACQCLAGRHRVHQCRS